MSVLKRIARAAVASSIFAFAFLASEAKASVIVPAPFGFPIADCGTVGTVPGLGDFDGDGILDTCKVWFADSGLGAFQFAGLEAFSTGDRIFVTGTVCVVCINFCPAGVIIFPTISSCTGGK